ncbi:CoA-binding protein [Herbiconiux daphne]|uniref:CoA-binding protein n=1 Tax=Herbiconiux daphne TaxID=2970914 RepID=A0ABT2H7J1_9MICO|nr:CoA-binding protein [Herbiconiux daphne]MCS5735907.1 CoA-binding protein [Herbiconiux daphne]
MNDEALKSLLESARTIAIVGLSTDPEKTSNKIGQVMIDAGFDVIPVHPKAAEVLGRKAYPSLAEVPVAIDIVDVFRPSDEAAGVAQQAVDAGAGALWLQLGISSPEARATAEASGLTYVEDTCIGATTLRLGVTARQG